jgi:uncharacterized protein (TIGR03435 family)
MRLKNRMLRLTVPLVCAVAALSAQDPVEFEVASVKPSNSASIGLSINNSASGDLTIDNAPLRTIVAFAYDVREFQVSGGPKWMDTDRYNIAAKSTRAVAALPGAERGKAVRQMTQALLANRFQMVAHREMKDVPVYALVVAKGGSHLTPHTGDNPQKGIGPIADGLKFTGVTMEIFATHGLSPRLGNIVLDKTELQGEYDFELHFVSGGLAKPGIEASQTAADPAAPGIAMAVQEQLGLKLETRKAPVQVIVVERAEKATAN